MKTKLFFFFFALCSLSLVAQPHGERGDKRAMFDKMTAEKWTAISATAALTDDEKKAVYFVFFDYEKAIWELMNSNRELFRNTHKRIRANETVNYVEVNDLAINYETQQASLLKDYHEKLKKLLSSEKLFRYYQAERAFKMKLMKNFPKQPHEKG